MKRMEILINLLKQPSDAKKKKGMYVLLTLKNRMWKSLLNPISTLKLLLLKCFGSYKKPYRNDQ
jgi:hypothetical protein